MYYIPRGGTRGGADQFTWDSVKTDKDREYYLGWYFCLDFKFCLCFVTSLYLWKKHVRGAST